MEVYFLPLQFIADVVPFMKDQVPIISVLSAASMQYKYNSHFPWDFFHSAISLGILKAPM
jgi:hypothetical protein